MSDVRQEIVKYGNWNTYVSYAGTKKEGAVLLLHGSGPGASAWSNWQTAVPAFSKDAMTLAPDLAGFSKSVAPEHPDTVLGWMEMWANQLFGLLDHFGCTRVNVVGNSLGGGVALQLLLRRPELFNRVALMGAVGAPFELTQELDIIWGFYDDPSEEKMARIISWFAYDESFLGDRLKEIAAMRYKAAMEPSVRKAFAAMFPAPRQRHVDDLRIPPADLRRIKNPTLLIHGNEDYIVPVETSHYLLQHLGGPAQMHIYRRCSHWTQIEYRESFERLVSTFFRGEL
jgi:2-hydroxymuconate-semialdehyde hydrolase